MQNALSNRHHASHPYPQCEVIIPSVLTVRSRVESELYYLNGPVFTSGVKIWALCRIRSLWGHSDKIFAA